MNINADAVLAAENLRVELESVTECDGLTLFRLTYAPVGGACSLDRLRVRGPLVAERARFYSAAGDTQGTCIQADVFPAKQGKVYDSLVHTRCVYCSPTFPTLFWVADRDVSFCYAADNDKGWLIRDDAPAVEVIREGDTVSLWLNLVDKPWNLTAPRTLEFALQAGPTKPLPAGWRGVQDAVHPTEAPIQLRQTDGSSSTMRGGGAGFLHPGITPEEQKRSREHLESLAEGGRKFLIGYNRWPLICTGFPEVRVFRGEWGIGKEPFEKEPNLSQSNAWKRKYFGENKSRYVQAETNAAPSYIDYLIYAYDLALTLTPLCGNYDDTGYPTPVYDEELGIGFIREDGRKVWSSGLWAMRERWKRAQYVNFLHGRPNYLADSQSCYAQFIPAQNFIGIWRPCERGYYNHFNDRDNVEFYRTLERYAAFNPARQFGQIPDIGLSSPHTGAELARDTRGMVMLTFLHDQDLGCFNHTSRDNKVIGDLRHAKNLFRPWEEEVGFLGYWEVPSRFASTVPAVRVSAFTRPDSVLLVVGNTGDAVKATITLAWDALKLDSAQVMVFDAETGAPVAVGTGPVKSFDLAVERHDLRLILVAPAGRFSLPTCAR